MSEITAYTQWFLDELTKQVDITPPTSFPDKVQHVKDILDNDITGLIVPVFQFMVDAVADVKFSIETDKPELTKKLNKWLEELNIKFRGQIPIGFGEFVKEYSKERWTSSLMVSQLDWDIKGDLVLPTTMWVLDGQYVRVGGDSKKLGGLTYKFNKKDLEDIYVHKLARWYEKYPVPYLIKRVYGNWVLKKYLKEKGSALLREALVLLLIKKGDKSREDLTYDSDDFADILTELKTVFENARKEGSIPAWATGYDTSIEHMIPELSRLFSRIIYEEIDRDILSGLGLIDIVQGIGTTRRESILNPKPLMHQVYNTVDDIKRLLLEIVKEIADKNLEGGHDKYFSKNVKIRIVNTPVKAFWTEDFLVLIRSAYDRGIVSKKDYNESLGFDFETTLKRREVELKEGYEIILYPPVTINQEATESSEETERLHQILNDDNKVTDDKTNPVEKKQFKLSAEEIIGAPYDTVKDLPVKVRKNIEDIKLQRIFLHSFNSTWNKFSDYDNKIRESKASASGWSAVKRFGFKGKDNKWHLKEKYKKSKEN